MELSDTLRARVRAAGDSQNKIARDSGVNQASLNLFMNEKRDLRLQTATRLADYFGLCFCPADSLSERSR